MKVLAVKASGHGYVGPLDLVGGATVAYSQRALSRAKKGSALFTLRRDSDDATQTFNSSTANGSAPLTAIASFIGASHGFVTSWKDQSGHDSHALQATVGNQPKFIAALDGGKSSFQFDSTVPQGLVTGGNVSISGGAITIFMVIRSQGVGMAVNYLVVGGMNAAPLSFGIAHFTDTAGQLYANLGINNWIYEEISTVGSLIEFGALNVSDISGDFNGLKAFVNNLEILHHDKSNNGSAPCDDVSFPFVIGDDSPGLDDVPFRGCITELLVYPSKLSDANKLKIRQNIAAYYGITLA